VNFFILFFIFKNFLLGGTMCGWSQVRLSSGKMNSYHWRIDFERSAAVNNKSNSQKKLIEQTGRAWDGK